MNTIPVLLCIDVEPDDRAVDPRRPEDWRGFEGLIEFVRDVRPRLEAATRRPAHVSWFIRMDPQVTQAYGSAGWAATRYRTALDMLEAAGDAIGLHVHAWRWDDTRSRWVHHFADDWVSHCVESGFAAFEASFGRPCREVRFGDHWMNDATSDLIRRLGARCDLTVEPGRTGTSAHEAFTGQMPDYSNVPRLPYFPSQGDFRTAAPAGARGFCIMPVSTAPSAWATTPGVERIALPSGPAGPGLVPDYEGYHDTATADTIGGWVWNRARPEQRLDVEVLDGAGLVATVGATAYRPDLEMAGKGDGRLAFRCATPLHLKDGRPHTIRVRIAGTDVELIDTPRTIPATTDRGEAVVPLLLSHDPLEFGLMVDRLLTSLGHPYLNLPVRSDMGASPDALALVARNIGYLMSHPLANRFSFTTPERLLENWPSLAAHAGLGSQSRRA